MGFLDRLKGKSGGKIEVVIEPTAAGPGDQITVRIDVKEELDAKAEELRAGITCTGIYKVRERRRDADGDIDTDIETRTVELYEEVHPLQLAHGAQSAPFILPDDAQPASPGAVQWQAWARVDRDKGLDIVERVDLDVRIPSARITSSRDADPSSDGLALVGVPAVVREGETLTGTVVVELPEDLKCNAVALRLHRRATYTAEAINHYSVYRGDLVVDLISDLFGGSVIKSMGDRIVEDKQVAEVELAGKQEFAAGRREQFEFSIDVPLAGPTSSHQHAQIDWRVEAVLDRRLRGDKAVAAPVIVL